MRTSELILRIFANEKGAVESTQFDDWIGTLIKSGLVEKQVEDDCFSYRLTKASINYLRKKGISID